MADGFDKQIRALRAIARDGGALEIADGLAQVWVDKSRDVMHKDTWQLWNRTQVTSVSGGRTSGAAELEADTPYAGYHNYGNPRIGVGPVRFWEAGRDAAVREADQLGGRIETELRRSLESGGVWNPRRLFGR